MRKVIQTQGGLMHHKCKHALISDKGFEEKMCDIIENSKMGDFSCYPDGIKSAIINYHHHSTPLFLADTKIIVEAFMKKNDADTFYARYFSKIVVNANIYFQLSGPECTLFAKKKCGPFSCIFFNKESSPSGCIQCALLPCYFIINHIKIFGFLSPDMITCSSLPFY